MKITTHDPKTPDRTIRANQLGAGDVFRFAEDSFQEALVAGTFWLRVAEPDKDKNNRLFAVSLDGKTARVFDQDRLVVKHDSTIHILSA